MELTEWGGIKSTTDALGNSRVYDYYADTSGEIPATEADYRFIKTTIKNSKSIDESTGNIIDVDEEYVSKAYYHQDNENPLLNGMVEHSVDPMGIELHVGYQDIQLPGNHMIRVVKETTNRYQGKNYNKTTYQYDVKGNVLSVINPLGDTVQSELDARGNLLKSTATVSGISASTSYSYDKKGRLSSTTDSKGWKVSVGYDSRNNPVVSTDGKGRSVKYQYDGFNRIEYTENPDGTTARTTYNHLGQVLYSGLFKNKTEAEKDINKAAKVDGTNITQYEYDDLGRVTKVYYAMDLHQNASTTKTVTSQYSAPGSSENYVITKEHNPGMPQKYTTSYSNAAGQVIREEIKGEGIEPLSTKYYYDDLGRVIQSVGPSGIISWAKYDVNIDNAVVTMKSGVKTAGDNKNIHLSTAEYNYRGEKTWAEDAEGHRVSYAYDDYSRLVQVSEPVVVHGKENGKNVTKYTHNQAIDGFIVNTSEAFNGKTVKTYVNAHGETVKVEDIGGDITQISEYGYDTDGTLLWEKRADGSKVSYEYDVLTGKTLREYITCENNQEEKRAEYHYDGFGRLIQQADIIQNIDEGLAENDKSAVVYTTGYRYNQIGELVKREYKLYTFKTNATSETLGENEYQDPKTKDVYSLKNEISVNYGYNNDGNLIYMSYALGKEKNIGVSTHYQYDGLGRLVQTDAMDGSKNGNKQKEWIEKYTYNDIGQLTEVKTNLGFMEEGNDNILAKNLSYDNLGRTYKSMYTLNEEQVVETFEFAFDEKRGLITSESYSSSFIGGENERFVKTFEYDITGKLSSSTYQKNSGTELSSSYGYDTVGNRVFMSKQLEEEGEVNTYQTNNTYNGMNQLEKSSQTKNDSAYQTMTYESYTKLGSQEKVKIENHWEHKVEHKEYQYDLGNNLNKAISSKDEENDLISQSYYTIDGQRIRKTTLDPSVPEDAPAGAKGININYLYMGSQLVATYDDEMMPYELNIIGSDVIANRVIESEHTAEENHSFQFYLYDLRGSVTSIIDNQGKQIKGYEYDEFGKTEVKGDEEVQNSIAYTGAVFDEESGLYYMNARHYDPESGRFLQQDTYRGSASAQWTQHLYAYCGNNPISMVDPTGHEARPLTQLEEELKKIRIDAASTMKWQLYTHHAKNTLTDKIRNDIVTRIEGAMNKDLERTKRKYYNSGKKKAATGTVYHEDDDSVTIYHFYSIEDSKSMLLASDFERATQLSSDAMYRKDVDGKSFNVAYINVGPLQGFNAVKIDLFKGGKGTESGIYDNGKISIVWEGISLGNMAAYVNEEFRHSMGDRSEFYMEYLADLKEGVPAGDQLPEALIKSRYTHPKGAPHLNPKLNSNAVNGSGKGGKGEINIKDKDDEYIKWYKYFAGH